MVASVGEAAVSGVSLVDNVMVLFINLFAALATGGAVIAGQYLGQEDRKSSGKAATQLIWFMTAVSFGIMMLIYLGKKDVYKRQVYGWKLRRRTPGFDYLGESITGSWER